MTSIATDTSRLLPDPVSGPIKYPLISVDDHVAEPPTLFLDRLPAALRRSAPRVIEGDDGQEWWEIDGERTRVGVQSVAAAGIRDKHNEPIRYSQIRRGAYNAALRLADMDVAGVAVSMNFPSSIFGFVGKKFLSMKDQAAGRACLEAWNDWIAEEWVAPFPERYIGQHLAWLNEVDIAAAQVRSNAERGFKALSFSENPVRLGLPSLYSKHWDPLFEACQETGTVVSLHVGTGGLAMAPSPEMPYPGRAVVFQANGLLTAVEWIFTGIPMRFPGLKIAFSEAGIGWVALIIDRLNRLDKAGRFSAELMEWDQHWLAGGLPGIATGSPEDVVALQAAIGYRESEIMGSGVLAETFQRNFYFTTFGEPISMELRHRIGVDKIMLECDYPHIDSAWPLVQDEIAEAVQGLGGEEVERVVFKNAAELYRHPLPALPWLPTSTGC